MKIIWINNGKYISAINKKFIIFFFIWITRRILKTIWILTTILKIKTFSG